jgi:hypothetical protein
VSVRVRQRPRIVPVGARRWWRRARHSWSDWTPSSRVGRVGPPLVASATLQAARCAPVQPQPVRRIHAHAAQRGGRLGSAASCAVRRADAGKLLRVRVSRKHAAAHVCESMIIHSPVPHLVFAATVRHSALSVSCHSPDARSAPLKNPCHRPTTAFRSAVIDERCTRARVSITGATDACHTAQCGHPTYPL